MSLTDLPTLTTGPTPIGIDIADLRPTEQVQARRAARPAVPGKHRADRASQLGLTYAWMFVGHEPAPAHRRGKRHEPGVHTVRETWAAVYGPVQAVTA